MLQIIARGVPSRHSTLARPFSLERLLSPSQTLSILFVCLIAIGTTLLTLPVAVRSGRPLSLWDALFTATSAVCVTGLSVIDIGSRLSLFGQLVTLGLIQVGGLGYMTIGTLTAVFLGKMAIRDRLVMQEAMEQFSFENLTIFAKRVMVMTLVIETVGAALLWAFIREKGSFFHTVYLSVYHSVSAFCNAGFSLYSEGFIRFRGNLGANVTLMALIVLGGLGFVVLSDMLLLARNKKRLSTHSRVAMSVTVLLISVGALFLFLSEISNPSTLARVPGKEKVLMSLFQSITSRTAGFNTLPIENLHIVSLFFIMGLMFVGASPGGTGGGIKTTTFAVMISSIWTTFRGRKDVNIFGRRMPLDIILKSFTVSVLAFLFIAFFSLFILETERRFSFIQVLFEVTSAFGTVGLSMGITPLLSVPGTMALVLAMFLGRLGPIVVGAAALHEAQLPYRYAEEKILVG